MPQTNPGGFEKALTWREHSCSQRQGLRGAADGARSKPVMEAAFRQYGLPARMRTDNGAPFGSNGESGLTQLSVWWIKLGIVPEHIRPGKPQENGRHERMHRTLKQATASPPASTLRAQEQRFDHFRREYNEERPREALSMRTPGVGLSAFAAGLSGTTAGSAYPA